LDVRLVAFDSMGVRSSATFIDAGSIRVFIDPSAALAPLRYGLRPHPLEVRELERKLGEIEQLLRDADIVVNTHYHYDHHDPGWRLSAEAYRGKTVIVKDPEASINHSQRWRARRYLSALRGVAKGVLIADSREYSFGGLRLKFSSPVPHGADERLGYVVQVLVEERGERVLFTSDVEGPCLEPQASFALESAPELAIVDGPSAYLAGYGYPEECVGKSLENLARLLRSGVERLVVDHHFVRDLRYKEILSPLRREFGSRVATAAEFMGVADGPLEAMRRELYGGRSGEQPG